MVTRERPVGERGPATFTLSPSCQLFHIARFSLGLSGCGGGKVLRMSLKCSLSQGCSTALVQLLCTPFTRTSPVDGWSRLISAWLCHSSSAGEAGMPVCPVGFPARAGIGHALQWSGLIDSPHPDAHLLTLSVSAFVRSNFLASASGSVTSTTSALLRLRLTLSVSHQLLLLCHSKPVSLRTFQMWCRCAHHRQPVRSLTQSPPQRRKRPASAPVLLTLGFPAYLRQDALPLRCCVDGPASTSVARL